MNLPLGRAAGPGAPEWQRVEYHPCALICRGHMRVLDGSSLSGDYCTIQQADGSSRNAWVCQFCFGLYLAVRERSPSFGLLITAIVRSP